jgi:hypothetical protein
MTLISLGSTNVFARGPCNGAMGLMCGRCGALRGLQKSSRFAKTDGQAKATKECEFIELQQQSSGALVAMLSWNPHMNVDRNCC